MMCLALHRETIKHANEKIFFSNGFAGYYGEFEVRYLISITNTLLQQVSCNGME